MKLVKWTLWVTMLTITSFAAQARDSRQNFNIEMALAEGRNKGVIATDIQLRFGEDSLISGTKRIGEYTANKKTNAFNKTDMEACHWAFLSAIKSLQNRARKQGGDAVVNIRSNYKQQDFRSATEFQCGAGHLMAGVTMVGTVVKL
ncbi:hypothetical protein [Ferrimonas senticii]|uniref:hypothetical protein n=1 Tax=Ferrimonas senticii TaxID=394566 RepID=UPI00040B7C3B|nr:hypothetical protein [Ferrimonas senticii]